MISGGDVTPKSTKNEVQKLLFWVVLCPQRTSQISPLVLGIILVECGTLGTLWHPSFDNFFSGNFLKNLAFSGESPPQSTMESPPPIYNA